MSHIGTHIEKLKILRFEGFKVSRFYTHLRELELQLRFLNIEKSLGIRVNTNKMLQVAFNVLQFQSFNTEDVRAALI